MAKSHFEPVWANPLGKRVLAHNLTAPGQPSESEGRRHAWHAADGPWPAAKRAGAPWQHWMW